MFKPTKAKSVTEYISLIEEPRRSDVKNLHKMITKLIPKAKAKLWGSVIGYDSFHYKSKSGREGEWFPVGLASQKGYISIYLCAVENGTYIAERHKKDFPKASIGKSCIRFKKSEDIDLKLLGQLIKKAAKIKSFGVQ